MEISETSALIEEFRKIPTASISDAMGKKNAMLSYMRPLLDGAIISGCAVTVRTKPGDPKKPTEAIMYAHKGDIIVIDARGSEESACWGGVDSVASKQKGLAGAIVDGAVRDVANIRSIGFPVWSRVVTPRTGEAAGRGEINVQIQCAGVVVKPGDIIVADIDGIVVIPIEEAGIVLEESIKRERIEQSIMQELRNGVNVKEAIDRYCTF